MRFIEQLAYISRSPKRFVCVHLGTTTEDRVYGTIIDVGSEYIELRMHTTRTSYVENNFTKGIKEVWFEPTDVTYIPVGQIVRVTPFPDADIREAKA